MKSFFQKLFNFPVHNFVLATFMIPLSPGPQWTELQYSSIPKNTVQFQGEKLNIQVQKSASPLIYKFSKTQNIKTVILKGKVLGPSLRIPASVTQGDEGFDDYVFRLGLVLKGKKRLSWLQRKVAPQWVRTLFSLAPKGVGVSGLYFLGVGSQQKVHGIKRTHPKSELLKEEVVTLVQPNGEFVLKKTFRSPKETLAFWLSADGDDSGAQFHIEISSLSVETAP